MEEKHTCNCENKANSEDLKRLELLALGTYSQRLMNKLMVFIAVIIMMSIIAGTVIAVYGINRYHHYMMNTEVVEKVEVVEEIIQNADRDGENYKANGNIIQNSNFDNSSIGGNYGRDKQK